jgi:hypothetical protein
MLMVVHRAATNVSGDHEEEAMTMQKRIIRWALITAFTLLVTYLLKERSARRIA